MTKELKLLEENFAKSNNIHIKQLCPHILLSADMTSSVRFAKDYRNILMDNDVLCEMFLPEEMTFLELEFPEPGAGNRRFDVFFDTPYEHACGNFYGVILVRLNHWEKVNLVQDYQFIEFLDFVEELSQTVRFVFCFSETAKNYEKLKELLGKISNLYEIKLAKMNIRSAEAFVKQYLFKYGIYIDEEAMDEMQPCLQKVIQESCYDGEASLRRFAEMLSFNYILAQNNEKTTVREIYEKTEEMYLKEGTVQRSIGF